jgi:hypothetical protein
MPRLLADLYAAGLIQIGTFYQDGAEVPLRFHWEMLPSYPWLLRQVADRLADRITSYTPPTERLVCNGALIATATLVSTQTGIPLVYSRDNTAGVQQLIGAYDVGHPTLLLVDAYRDATQWQAFIARADGVGLRVRAIMPLVQWGTTQADVATVVLPLYTLEYVLATLREHEAITVRQYEHLRAWSISRSHGQAHEVAE